MDFDEMLKSWKEQEDKPLYDVNRDLLQLVIRNEQAGMRRALRWDQWTTYIVGTAMTALAGAVLWWFLDHGGAGSYAILAVVGIAAFALWIGALWLSRRRQAERERVFGNTLEEELRRNLSLIDYRLSQVGRWSNLMLWSAPIVAGSVLIFWLILKINDATGFWFNAGFVIFMVGSVAYTTWESSRAAREELLPRRRRLSGLLDTLTSA
ncbi:hypothetical protein [Sphingopyxis sp.]|uniref:hypothetical protein n=1 Tax=Sphingopyxis sp. TaxID=1908224 RepID=UPI002D782E8B|nr:hypothetical protein [Sphingopyxis sp.]HET6523831.1 hypothetical protein [Sphingopyxis sp.]